MAAQVVTAVFTGVTSLVLIVLLIVFLLVFKHIYKTLKSFAINAILLSPESNSATVLADLDKYLAKSEDKKTPKAKTSMTESKQTFVKDIEASTHSRGVSTTLSHSSRPLTQVDSKSEVKTSSDPSIKYSKPMAERQKRSMDPKIRRREDIECNLMPIHSIRAESNLMSDTVLRMDAIIDQTFDSMIESFDDMNERTLQYHYSSDD